MQKRWLGLTSLAFIVACGGGSSKSNSTAGAAVHCSYAAGYCLTVTAPAITTAQQTGLQSECTTDGGTYGSGACTAANAVTGTCTLPASMVTTPVTGVAVSATFYAPPFNATTASAQCGQLTGTWSAGGGGGGGGGGGTSTVMSCSYSYAGLGTALCEQENSTTPFTQAEVDSFRGFCTGQSGVTATSALTACSTSGALGACAYPAQSGYSTRIVYYSVAGQTLADAQAQCTSPGVWQ
jgi:hypothetical protein